MSGNCQVRRVLACTDKNNLCPNIGYRQHEQSHDRIDAFATSPQLSLYAAIHGPQIQLIFRAEGRSPRLSLIRTIELTMDLALLRGPPTGCNRERRRGDHASPEASMIGDPFERIEVPMPSVFSWRRHRHRASRRRRPEDPLRHSWRRSPASRGSTRLRLRETDAESADRATLIRANV